MGYPCIGDGSTAQAFQFRALSGPPSNTFEIVSQSTGQCLDKYRFGIRQESCTGSVPPDYTNAEWTLRQLGTTGHRYQFVVATTVGTSSPECVQVEPKSNGYPGPVFELTACNAALPAQVLTLTAAP